jgi:Protein of unknown function (DUF3604)
MSRRAPRIPAWALSLTTLALAAPLTAQDVVPSRDQVTAPRAEYSPAKFFDVEMPEGTVMELQDRAYTSPIWYTPGN